ncbi:MAG: winged helix-turn-helix transcriptional regulator [Defluviitaleaceae bacterium]|nr:winged helix-turn-helix transcriptional regulator [Defluviitaleaceae bacterium]
MQAALKNCPRCRKIANLTIYKFCDDCVREDEETYQKVYDYLRENPGISLVELSTKTEVSTKRITEYVKEGRIQMVEKILSCKICSEKIEKGELCLICEENQKKALIESLSSIKKLDKPAASAKMHTGQRRKPRE